MTMTTTKTMIIKSENCRNRTALFVLLILCCRGGDPVHSFLPSSPTFITAIPSVPSIRKAVWKTTAKTELATTVLPQEVISLQVADDTTTGSSTSVEDDTGILVSLFGSVKAFQDFWNFDFGRRVVHLSSHASATSSNGSIGIDMAQLYDSNEYITLRKRGTQMALNKTAMSYLEFANDYIVAGGGSAVVPITPNDYLYPRLKEPLERALQQSPESLSINVYHSGNQAVALNRHYDAYDVLVWQTNGKKEWEVQIDASNTWKNITLQPGDLLYIPKGVYHAATTAQGCNISTHATIGFLETK
ncbi:Cupin 4 family protein [Seminavis robusta]|uniref:Bifunctional lysine-specific demethylase and histidyl-hydroxylase n=1 Tax=Seminavis robusta TaxID=568900 RepID=A0A9N8HBM7_9STRA|nr:Cupin 4 family protein [Seminavis robusta]|eukprot:Sro283_g107730.1 Cupin 4 family protein (302) ;mRNA; f:35813-36718